MFRDHVFGLDAQVTGVFDRLDEYDDGQGIEAQRGVIGGRTVQLANERADEIQALTGVIVVMGYALPTDRECLRPSA